MEYSFDTWTSIFLFASAQGIFLSILLISKKKTSYYLLAAICLLFSITLVEYVFYWTGYRFLFPHLNRVSAPYYFVYGPLFYFFVKSVIDEKSYSFKKMLPHFIPGLVFLSMNVPYYISGTETKIQMMSTIPSSNTWIIVMSKLIPWTQILSLFLYWALAYGVIKKFGDALKDDRLVKVSSALFLGFALGFLSYYIMIEFYGYLKGYDYAISFSMSVFIYVTGYLGYSYGSKKETSVSTPKYQHSSLGSVEKKKISQKLIEVMGSNKLFLQKDLTLQRLAISIDMQKHHVSEVLNDELGEKFSDFVNRYRIEEAKKLLLEKHEVLTIHGIALESGFSNKTSFNKAFRRFVGCTPSEFRKQETAKGVNPD
ncbi:MAG: AraC family transcriptional regulator [Balneola sp.]|nr:MAG: AraC family transcriptional regulator [Balneola sp.]